MSPPISLSVPCLCSWRSRPAAWAALRIGALLTILTLPIQPAWAQQAVNSADLASRSLEDLMNVEVTSVSKKEQKLSQVAAAIFVISQQDIHDSGATNIPDLLRMVPGLDVAQIDANTWAISSRGFNLQFSNKLLVLIDGRAVYSPLYGGVNWDVQDVPLEDIERIEVIRGPGGTVWGANAVNGVINIVTKKASDTHGVLVSSSGGSQGQAFGVAQYGGQINAGTSFRVFTKYLNEDQSPGPAGQYGGDGWHLLHGGFRLDTQMSARDSVTFQGDLYTGREGAIIVHSEFLPPANVQEESFTNLGGANLLTRWNHAFSPRSDTTLQVYIDNYERGGPEVREARTTVDIDFQNHLAIGNRQDLIWGVGFRNTADRTSGTVDEAFVPANFDGSLYNLFVQDQIVLKPDRVSLYVGTKLENDYFTGFDLQPSVRLAWMLDSRSTLWAAVSRATRTPSRLDTGIRGSLAALPGPAEAALFGNPDLKSEHVVAYELGYRAQPSDRISLDLATFFNSYYGLESIETLPPFFDPNSNPPLEIYPQQLANKEYGTTEGIEGFANWKITSRWTLSPGYSFLEMHLHTQRNSSDTTTVAFAQGNNPGHQAQLRSRLRLGRGLTWDASAFFVDRLAAPQLPSYTRVDTQLIWQFAESAELSLVGQNLQQDHHFEFNDILQSINSSQIKRSAYAKFTWRF